MQPQFFALLLLASVTNVFANTPCIDTDGDGWGWDGNDSCRIIAAECEDTPPLNDGWGWDGATSCRVPITELSCIDSPPIGDGWGWDGVKSCRVDMNNEPTCIDSPPVGDGWGWNGSESCSLAVTMPVCVDIAPIGDGIGWDGQQACSISAVRLQRIAGDNPSVSANARYVTFRSYDNSLYPNDNHGFSDVFIQDNDNGAVQLLSAGVNGQIANNHSGTSVISSDGQTIVFSSFATNLVLPNANGSQQLYLYDVQAGNARTISTDAIGTLGRGQSFAPSISADGNFIAYLSNANNLVANDTNGETDVFLYNATTAETIKLTDPEHRALSLEDMSANGRFVLFKSVLPSTENSFNIGIFVHDTLTGTTEEITTEFNGLTVGTPVSLSISDNGRKIAFYRPGNFARISILDRGTFITSLSTPPGQSYHPAISPDGRYVAYTATADRNVYLRDLFAHTTTLVSESISGEGTDGASYEPQFTADGTHLYFRSSANNLVADDTRSNVPDTFIYRLSDN